MTQRTTFAKLQRERAKKQRAEEKRARRRGEDMVPVTSDAAPTRSLRGPSVPDVEGDGSRLTPDRLLRLVEQLTEAHEAGLLSDEEMDEKRTILMSRV